MSVASTRKYKFSLSLKDLRPRGNIKKERIKAKDRWIDRWAWGLGWIKWPVKTWYREKEMAVKAIKKANRVRELISFWDIKKSKGPSGSGGNSAFIMESGLIAAMFFPHKPAPKGRLDAQTKTFPKRQPRYYTVGILRFLMDLSLAFSGAYGSSLPVSPPSLLKA
jgi:hypothetical protein